MSKKKKHRKQVNNTQTQQEVPEKRAFRVPETTVTFDDAFSNALQKMLEAPDQTEQPKPETVEGFPILELPERKAGSDSRKHHGQNVAKADLDGRVESALTAFLPPEEAEKMPESMLREQAVSEEPAQGLRENVISENSIRTELLRTFSDSPLSRMENGSFAAMQNEEPAEEWDDDRFVEEDTMPAVKPYYDKQEEPAAEPYFDEPEAPAFEPHFDEPEAPAFEPYYDKPEEPVAEPYFDEPEEPAAEPYFDEPEEPAAEPYFDEPEEPEAELYFDESEAPAFSQSGWMSDAVQPLELTEMPAHSGAEEPNELSDFFMDPKLLEKPKTSEESGIFMVLRPSADENVPETPETFVVPDIHEESTEKAPEVFKVPDLPDHSETLEAPEVFAVPQTLRAEPLEEQSYAQLIPAEEAAPHTKEDRPQKEDTASLLSVVQSLLGTDEPVKEYQRTRRDDTSSIQDVPANQDTVRFTPLRDKHREYEEEQPAEAKKTAESVSAVSTEPDVQNMFWREFDELKNMLGTDEPVSAKNDSYDRTQDENVTAQPAPVYAEENAAHADETAVASSSDETKHADTDLQVQPNRADSGPRKKNSVFGALRKRYTRRSELLQQTKETTQWTDEEEPTPTVAEEPEAPAAAYYEEPAPVVPEEPEAPAAAYYEEPAPIVPEEPEAPAAAYYEEPAPVVPEEPDIPSASALFEEESPETEPAPQPESEQKKLFDKLDELLNTPVVIQSASVKAIEPDPAEEQPEIEETLIPSVQPEPQEFVTPSVQPKPAAPRRKAGAAHTQAERRISDATQRIPVLPKETVAEPAADRRPEEAYRTYAKKLGTSRTRFAIAAVVTLLSVLLTVYSSAGWSFLPKTVDVSVAAYILLALLAIAAVAAYDVFAEALKDLSKLKMTVPILVAIAAVVVAADTVQAASADRVPFCAAASVLIFFLLWDRYDGINGILTTLRVLRDAKEPTGIVEVHDVMKGRVGLSRADGSVEDFMDKLEKEPPTRTMMQFYVPAMIIFSAVAAVIISAKSGSPFLWTASLLLLGSVPLLGILNFNRLFSILSKRLSDSDAALCGWYGAETFGGDHSILIGDRDLFPERNIKLNGIKVISNDADRVIGYAAATAKAAGSVLYPLFEEELRSRNARHYRVERFRFYESGGIGAEISGDIVLMGTLDFMKRMGVHMEGCMKLKQAVYTSVNGELAAVFAIKYTPKDSVRRGLAAIAENRHFRTVFVTRDFLMTPEMIRDKYEISLTNTLYPTAKERMRLSETEFKEKGKQGALMIDDSFGSFADAAAGGRVLQSAVSTAIILTLLNGLIGFVLMAVLSFRQGFEAATAVNLLLYQFIWFIPTLLLTGWTRRY